MSLEAIKMVNATELQVAEKKTEAAAAAKKLVSDAEVEGRGLLQRTKAEIGSQGKVWKQEAEQKAQERTDEILQQAAKEGDELCQAAEKKLEKAAEFIVGKVVNG